jgi:hypothetical protein
MGILGGKVKVQIVMETGNAFHHKFPVSMDVSEMDVKPS